jgi:hypothetical protein
VGQDFPLNTKPTTRNYPCTYFFALVSSQPMMAPNRAAPTGLAVMPQLLQLSPAAKAMTCCSASPINAPITIAKNRLSTLNTCLLSANCFAEFKLVGNFQQPV